MSSSKTVILKTTNNRKLKIWGRKLKVTYNCKSM